MNPPPPAGEADPNTNYTDVEDSNLDPVSVEDRSTAAKKVRVCDLLCYICKVRLGADNSLRIGMDFQFMKLKVFHCELLECATKNCHRGASHLACHNLWPDSERKLSDLRCFYFCPAHSGSSQSAPD